MASDLERLAEGLRAFGSSTVPLTFQFASVEREVRDLTRDAARIQGVDTRKLVTALSNAEDRLAKAQVHVLALANRANTFANELAG